MTTDINGRMDAIKLMEEALNKLIHDALKKNLEKSIEEEIDEALAKTKEKLMTEAKESVRSEVDSITRICVSKLHETNTWTEALNVYVQHSDENDKRTLLAEGD